MATEKKILSDVKKYQDEADALEAQYHTERDALRAQGFSGDTLNDMTDHLLRKAKILTEKADALLALK